MCHQLNRNSVFVTPYIAESGKPLQMDSQNDLIINRRRAEAAQKIFPYTSVKTNLRTIPHVSIAVYLQNMYWQIANVSVMLWYYICTAKKKDAQILIVYGANREVWVFCNTVLWSKEYEQNLFTDKTASITWKDAKSSSITMVLHL